MGGVRVCTSRSSTHVLALPCALRLPSRSLREPAAPPPGPRRRSASGGWTPSPASPSPSTASRPSRRPAPAPAAARRSDVCGATPLASAETPERRSLPAPRGAGLRDRPPRTRRASGWPRAGAPDAGRAAGGAAVRRRELALPRGVPCRGLSRNGSLVRVCERVRAALCTHARRCTPAQANTLLGWPLACSPSRAIKGCGASLRRTVAGPFCRVVGHSLSCYFFAFVSCLFIKC